MRTSLPKYIATVLVLGASAWLPLSAQAGTLTLLGSGTTVDFYVDSDFKALAQTAEVWGDSVRFKGFSTRASTSGGDESDYIDFGGAAMVAVARSGYSFTSGYASDLTIEAPSTLAPTGSTVLVQGTGGLHAGQFDGVNFTDEGWLADVFSEASALSGNAAFGGTFISNSGSVTGSSGVGQALSIMDVYGWVNAQQSGTGDTSVSLYVMQFGISATADPAPGTVPEPASWLLCLTLLGASAAATRRRQR